MTTVDPRGKYAIDSYIDGPNTFFKLRLAASPVQVARLAKEDAKVDISIAYVAFSKLDYAFPGYAELKRMYNVANSEYYQGDNLLNRAILSQGNKALLLFSKAITAFTRAQAHALEISEALTPPAKNPQDLGLEPFGGDWGKWETKYQLKK